MAFQKVAKVGEIGPGNSKRAFVDDIPVAVFNVGGEYYAIEDTCSHAEASLSEGTVEGKVVECPKHGARFDIKTGDVLSAPAWAPVEAFTVKVAGDDILVSIDD